MAGLDLTTFEALTKQRYPDWEIMRLVYENNPLLALMPKDENFGGEVMKMPVIYGNNQNRSATFARAQAGTSTTQSKAFLLTRKKNYGIAKIDNETIEATKSNEGAFLAALETEVDGMLQNMGRDYGAKIYGSGTGSRGKIKAATTPTTTIELAEPNDVVFFEVGMVLEASSTNGGGSLRSTFPTVTAIDRDTGILTVSPTVNGDYAAGDYLFQRGDYDACISGLDAWIPYDDRAARLAASYYGVVRNADATRLGGLVFDASSYNYEEGLIEALARVWREGGKPDHVFMNPIDYAQLEKILGSKVQYTQLTAQISDGSKVQAVVGFDGLKIHYGGGAVNVIGDPNCPRKRAFALQMNTWKMSSLGKLVRLFETDGLRMLRLAADDGVELRAISYANVGCRAPGYNQQILLAS